MSVAKNLVGKKFGKLLVLKREKTSKNGKAMWLCQCECGNYTIVPTCKLTMGTTKSCGCKKRESKNSTHGLSKTRIYQEWIGIKKRCFDKKCKSFANYGGSGISVCKEWEKDFVAFYNWAISNGYQDNLTIDRKDVNGNYCPENCRWVDSKCQNNNRRNNLIFEYNGERKTLSEWCDLFNKNYKLVYQRIRIYKYSFEDAMFLEKHQRPIR